MADTKPEIVETDYNWQITYDGFSQVVPKDAAENKKAAVELADKSYKAWLKRQTPPAEK